MSGLSDLMAVFGFIDHAVVADPQLTPKVAALLPAYDQGAAGWYRGVSNWIPTALRLVEGSGEPAAPSGFERNVGDPADPPTANLKDALGAFALASDGALPDDDLLARRLLALAVLGRIWPSPAEAHSPLAQQLVGADLGADDLVRAVQPFTPDNDQRTAGRLLSLLVSEQRAGRPWEHLLAQATDEGLINPSTANQQCSPSSWTVKRTSVGTAIAFQTHKRIVGMTMSEFDDLFVPSHWTNFTPPWCSMSAGTASNGHDVYLEVLSTDCPPVLPLRLRTPLQFTVGMLPDSTGRCLQYRLAPDWSNQGGDGLVSVDEGSIVVREWQGALHLITTKRIQFRVFKEMPPLDAAWIAQFVWALGYDALAEYFVNRVALHKHIQVTDGTGSGHVPPRRHPGPPPSEQLGEIFRREVTECVTGIESALGKVKKGSYDATEYADDVGKFVKHVARYGGDLLNIASHFLSNDGRLVRRSFTSGRGTLVSEPLVLSPSPALPPQSPVSIVLECSALEPGLMQSAPGTSSETIAAPIVRCEPAQLGPHNEYRLIVEENDLHSQPGGTYTGTVKALTNSNAPEIASGAWIVIP